MALARLARAKQVLCPLTLGVRQSSSSLTPSNVSQNVPKQPKLHTTTSTQKSVLATLVSDPFYQSPVRFRDNKPPASVEPPLLPAHFSLADGLAFSGTSFGMPLGKSQVSGEVVFTTSLVGYPESMTDPSYRGQILVFTQPLIGNYGVPSGEKDAFGLFKHFESERIQVKGIIVSDYATKYSHWNAIESLGAWCGRSGVAALSGIDTRALVTHLREKGSMMGQISGVPPSAVSDTLLAQSNAYEKHNLIAEVSTDRVTVYNKGGKLKITLVDCGVKQNIIRCLVKLGAQVTVVPWNYDLCGDPANTVPDGIFLSNGPGCPLNATEAIQNLQDFMAIQSKALVPLPIFGICMGNQLLGLAAGFKVYKLPFGNRGHNQPAIDLETGSCFITSQNHGFALKDDEPTDIPAGWKPYFRNANDGSNEGIKHVTLPWSSVQFHPEAMGGPKDTEYLFKDFMDSVAQAKAKKVRASETSIAPKKASVASSSKS